MFSIHPTNVSGGDSMSRNLGTAQLVALVFVPLPFDFLAKFLKVLAEAAPGAAALNEGQSGEKAGRYAFDCSSQGFNRARNGRK